SVLGVFLMACDRSQTTAAGSTAILVAICLLALATGAMAAFPAAQSGTPADKTLTDTLGVLDNAIHLLGDPSSNSRKVLLDAVAAFPGDAADTVRAEVRTFLARAPEPGGEF